MTDKLELSELGTNVHDEGITKEEESKFQKSKPAWKLFAEATIPQIVAGWSRIITIFWIIAYLGLAIGFSYYMSRLVQKYLNYPVTTTLTITKQDVVDFPAVTVCNNNPLRKSVIEKLTNYTDLAHLDAYVGSELMTEIAEEFDLEFSCDERGLEKCGDSEECVPTEWICDGVADCSNEWDEGTFPEKLNCTEYSVEDYWPSEECLSGFALCSPKEPICAVPCNGIRECSDGSDETNPEYSCTLSCGGALDATSSDQTNATANYPSEYDPDSYCEWVITAQPGEVVSITFNTVEFGIETDSTCRYDSLTIHDGDNDAATAIKVDGKTKLCGSTAPTGPIVSTGQKMYLKFVSNFVTEGVGFEFTYTSVAASATREKRDAISNKSPKYSGTKKQKRNALTLTEQIEKRRKKLHWRGALERRKRSANYTNGYDYGYDYYDYFDYAAFKEFYKNWDPIKQYQNITPYDWRSAYRLSEKPDYSDFRAFALFNEFELKWYGSLREDFIAQCTFDGRKCDAIDFMMYQTPKFGNCFSFNSIRNKTKDEKGEWRDIRTTSKTGQQYGLKLTLFLDHEEYVGVLSQDAGAQVVITSHQDYPIPEDQGYGVSAGTLSRVSLRKEIVKRQPEPYGDCIKDFPASLNVPKSVKDQWPYSQQLCELYCQQKFLWDNCSCVDNYIGEFYEKGGDFGNKLCVAWDYEDANCRNEFYKRVQLQDKSVKCPCKPACDGSDYSSSLSATEWPSLQYTPYLINILRKSKSSRLQKALNQILNDSSVNMNQKHDKLKRNFARVEVYFQHLNFEQVEEEPSYLMASFLSDFGGQIGLFLGYSCLSLAQIVVLIYRLCGAFFLNRGVDQM
jgi:hypothetical protein